MDLNGTTLISGAGSGFGRLTAETLARRGGAVFAGVREASGRNAEVADGLRALAERDGLDLQVVELDVTDEASVESAAATVLDHAGRIDVVVHSAGILVSGPNEAIDLDQARAVFETNVLGVQRLNRAVLPSMRARRRGLLIHISAVVGRLARPFFGVFGASKWALEALAETYRYDLAEHGVDSVIVEPAPHPTPLWARGAGAGDPIRMRAYPDLTRRAAEARARMGTRFAGPHAPDPQAIADAITNLIDTPPGQRPLRTGVGAAAPNLELAALNQAQAEAQATLLASLGFGDTVQSPQRVPAAPR